SRIFLPASKDAFRQVMFTYAHELTHHWIQERCPLFRPSEAGGSDDEPGYWIVEGMAEMVAQFRWDLANRTFETLDPRGEALDTVASAAPEHLVPRERLFAISPRQLPDLPLE